MKKAFFIIITLFINFNLLSFDNEIKFNIEKILKINTCNKINENELHMFLRKLSQDLGLKFLRKNGFYKISLYSGESKELNIITNCVTDREFNGSVKLNLFELKKANIINILYVLNNLKKKDFNINLYVFNKDVKDSKFYKSFIKNNNLKNVISIDGEFPNINENSGYLNLKLIFPNVEFRNNIIRFLNFSGGVSSEFDKVPNYSQIELRFDPFNRSRVESLCENIRMLFMNNRRGYKIIPYFKSDKVIYKSWGTSSNVVNIEKGYNAINKLALLMSYFGKVTKNSNYYAIKFLSIYIKEDIHGKYLEISKSLKNIPNVNISSVVSSENQTEIYMNIRWNSSYSRRAIMQIINAKVKSVLKTARVKLVKEKNGFSYITPYKVTKRSKFNKSISNSLKNINIFESYSNGLNLSSYFHCLNIGPLKKNREIYTINDLKSLNKKYYKIFKTLEF